MGPFIDVYGLTAQRNRETIDRFIEMFTDRAAVEDLGDAKLMIVPLDWRGTGLPDWDDHEWEPARNVTHAIGRGLDYPRRAFHLSLSVVPKQGEKSVDGIEVIFTQDDFVVLSVKLRDQYSRPEKMALAKRSLAKITDQFDCTLGLIGYEFPPPLSEREFAQAVESKDYTVHVWRRAD